MKPKDFLDWYPYEQYGSKEAYQNYKILRKHNPDAFARLKLTGKFKYNTRMGVLLFFKGKKK